MEVVGVLVLAALVRTVLGGDRRGSLGPAIAVVAIAAFGYAVFNQASGFSQALLREHAGNSQLSPEVSEGVGGTIFPANEPFLAFADDRLPTGETVVLHCPRACGGGQNEWITYRLSPRRFVDTIDEADWVLFYGDGAQEASPFTRAAPAPTQFEPMFAFGRVQR